MKKRGSESEQRIEERVTAQAKVRTWRIRAELARRTGRTAHADRCDDKVRDWASRVRQIERTERSEK